MNTNWALHEPLALPAAGPQYHGSPLAMRRQCDASTTAIRWQDQSQTSAVALRILCVRATVLAYVCATRGRANGLYAELASGAGESARTASQPESNHSKLVWNYLVATPIGRAE